MNRPAPWGAIVDSVAEREPFAAGNATVDPISRDATWPGGSERLQPQTLKVLIALVGRRGDVVTRDELVQLCWGGRIVGDDVINRSISLLRQFADHCGGFEIETVPRSGYRLIEAKSGNEPPSTRHRKWIGLAAAALLFVIAGAVVVDRAGRTPPDAVMLEPFDVAGNASAARTLAQGVSADVNTALSAAGVHVIDAGAGGHSGQAAFILSGRAELPGSQLHLTAELKDARDQTVLWSTSFTRAASQMQSMQDQVATNVAAVLQCALETSRKPGGNLGRDSIELYLKACALEQSADPPSDQIEGLLNKLTQQQPGFAAGWARLAFFAANAAFTSTPSESARLRAEAATAAQKALQLDPKSGVAYNAIAELELGHEPFSTLHQQFQKVLRFDPDDAFTINNECELLMRMGRIEDAVQMCRRGVALEPLSPSQASDLADDLIVDGRNAEAQATLDHALEVWPDDARLKLNKIDYEARLGDPSVALSLLNNPDSQPQDARDVTLEAYRRLAEARRSRSETQKRAFLSWLKQEVAAGQLGNDFAAPAMASLGDTEGAFQTAFSAQGSLLHFDPAFLWQPEMLPLRRDPRFIALAAKFHIAEFWKTTGLWPDFCSVPGWPYDCKAQLAAVTKANA